MTTPTNADNANRVLVVDDEPMIREVLCEYLGRDGFDVVEAGDGDEAIAVVERERPALVLLDLMLPKRNGLEVLRHIRSSSNTPVILITARGDEADRVTGLELGADDYVVKPFSPREVAARVRSVLRRAHPAARAPVLTFSGFTVDLGRRSVTDTHGAETELTRKEFDLLAHFLNHEGNVINRDELLEKVWGSSSEWQDPSTVTVHVSRLRQKLEADPSNPVHFLTVYGIGYRFEA